jgi:putative ABC transport system substrate-binding protein
MKRPPTRALMLKFIRIILLLLLIAGTGEAGPVVVSVQSRDVAPYNAALSGFESVCHAENKRIFLSGLKEGELAQKLSAMGPHLILAIGPDALLAVQEVSALPILYTMVLNPGPLRKEASRITGVSINIPQEKQLDIILKALPGTTRIGLLYHPEETGGFVARSQKAAAVAGIQILAHAVETAREVPLALTKMEGAPEVFWLMPDQTVISPDTVPFLFDFAIARKIPVISFSNQYLAFGAFMSIAVDVFDLGRQTGEMANRILNGTPIPKISPAEAQKVVVTINRTVAGKLDIPINDAALAGIRVVD